MEREEAINAVSGAVAGFVTAVFVCPLDVLKTRLQVTRGGSTSISGGIRAIIAHEGIGGMYKGLGPTLLALLPNWAVYFVVYDSLKRRLSSRTPGGGGSTPLTHMAAAAGAGVTTILVTNPVWVVKTRMQCHGMVTAAGVEGSAAAAAAVAPNVAAVEATTVGRAAAACSAAFPVTAVAESGLRPAHVVEPGLRSVAAAEAVAAGSSGTAATAAPVKVASGTSSMELAAQPQRATLSTQEQQHPRKHEHRQAHSQQLGARHPPYGDDLRSSAQEVRTGSSSSTSSRGSSSTVSSCQGSGSSGGTAGSSQARGLGPGPLVFQPQERTAGVAGGSASGGGSRPAFPAPKVMMGGASTAIAPYLKRPPYKSTAEALMRIAREEGLRGLYSGLAPSMAGIAHVAIQFPLYEYSKQAVAQHKALEALARIRDSGEAGTADDKTSIAAVATANTDSLTIPELVATSAFAKVVASTVTYPHEVVRSYMHLSGSGPLSGLREAVSAVWREDGLRGFYRGCAANLVRTTPAAAMTFTTFELVSRALREAL